VKRISIDLSEPLGRVLTQALALPVGGVDAEIADALVEEAVRRLYEAANGRTVDTPLGRIPIAPAVAPWLKAAPLAVRTRSEFLTLAGLSSDSSGSFGAPEVAKP
jgi:hypothetical protein